MNLKHLKEQYDGKGIDEIESMARESNEAQEGFHKAFIGILFYLENTKRFKENPAYKAAQFSEYVSGFYGLSVQTYNRYRMAYFRYPVEAEKHGPGLINRIVHKCGAEMVPKVIKAIESEKKMGPEKEREIVDKFARPRLKKRKSRPSYSEIERENIALKKRVFELEARHKTDQEQIERLKATVQRYESGISKLIHVPPKVIENRTNA